MKKYLTYSIPAKATVVHGNSDRFKAIASTLEERYGFKPDPQMDLLYVESCLVTAGFNDNDDFFSNEELWKARRSPMLKPANWQHVDKDILGVTYSVQARDLAGNVIPFDQEEAPEGPFELITESVVFKLIHPERAQEIEARFSKGNLYVSMEAWFDNYDYVLGTDKGAVNKVVARNDKTAFLDGVLKAKGGSGRYEGQRIGRGLRDITFGGQGFVDRPANKRSDILSVEDMAHADGRNEDNLLDELRKFMSRLEELQPINSEKEQMNAIANAGNTALPPVDFDKLISDALARSEDKRAKAAAEEALRTRASELEKSNEALSVEKETLQKSKDSEIQALTQKLNDFSAKVEELVSATAGATGSTPPEIKKIDNVTGGDSAFQAKISWITESVKSLAAKAARAEELEAEFATAALELRGQEIRAIYNNLISEQEIEHLVTIGSACEDDKSWELWINQQKWVAKKLADKFEDSEEDKKEDKAGEDKLAKKKKGAKGEAEDATQAVEALLSNAGESYYPGQSDLGMKSGVNPGSIRTPRFKIAGGSNDSATVDPSKVLANAKPEKSKVNVAGAGGSDEPASDEVPAMRALATELVGWSDKSEEKGDE